MLREAHSQCASINSDCRCTHAQLAASAARGPLAVRGARDEVQAVQGLGAGWAGASKLLERHGVELFCFGGGGGLG